MTGINGKPIELAPLYKGLCPEHGEQTFFIVVEQGTPQDGRYCQRCYVEKVIVPNCHRLTRM